MPVEINYINDDQVNQILSISESHFSDLKAKEIKPAKLTRTISAFANATGGELYIGIKEIKKRGQKVRKWEGFNDPEEANGHIQIFEELFPLGQYYSYTFLENDKERGLVLKVEVLKTRGISVASDGIPYIRRSAQNLPVNTLEKKHRLELNKGIASFENETIDVDTNLVTNSTVILDFLLSVIPTAEPEPWLRKQILIQDELPTVAGVILFAEEPQAILPKQSGIKIYRYETRDEEGSRATLSFDPMTIEGCAYDQIYEAVNAAVEVIQDIKILGTEGLEEIEYPPETLHEIVTNAVLHRDYSIASDIHIRIFDNRIEVESPGTLPGHITTDNILDEQFARNGTIVRLINKFPNPPNKDVGEGLNTAFEAMRRLRLKDPIIEEKESSVQVVIRHEPLASPEETVMEYLKSHEEISNSTARKLTGITSENTMKNVFYRLRDRGLLERVPGKKGPIAAWQAVEPDN
jgi:ATP-dependent DNA helicase RecG